MTVDKLKLDAIKNSYEKGRIDYNDIPEKYKEFIDEVMKKYKYNCSTYEVLLWESEITPKPEPHLITIQPQENDTAWVSDISKAFIFKNGNWVEVGE